MQAKQFWLGFTVCAVVCVSFASTATPVAIVTIDFDGPGYVAGEVPPAPWGEEWGNELHTVQAGVGYGGTQALVVGYISGGTGRGVFYELPNSLTSDMGAVSVSILFKPAGLPSGWNYGSQGSLHIGWGSMLYGYGESRGVVFEHYAGVAYISVPGGNLGTFTPNNWYQITFDIHADWLGMTVSAGLVGQTPASRTTSWSGNAITRIWTGPNQAARDATYDNLIVTTFLDCPSVDLTGDCFVGIEDFALMAEYWQAGDCMELDNCNGADIDTSGAVGLEDLAALASQWLTGSR